MSSAMSPGLAHDVDAAVEHDPGVVGHGQGDPGELLDQQDGDALSGQVGDGLVEALDDHRRQPHRELVEEQQRGVDGEGAGHGQHLLLAAGEGAGHLGAPLAQPGEALERQLADLAARCGSAE